MSQEDDTFRGCLIDQEAAWKTFLAAARQEAAVNPRYADRLPHVLRISLQIRSAQRSEEWRDVWVAMKDTDRLYRIRDADHIQLDIDERIPTDLQIVVTDKDGMHVLDADKVRYLLIALEPSAGEPPPIIEELIG
jgi:hypothetical protein